MTTTTTPAVDVDVWGYTPGRCARLKPPSTPPTASGDVDQVAAAAYALIVAAAAHGWPTATAWCSSTRGPVPSPTYGGLWRVVDVDGRVLREWEDEPGDATDESEEEPVALSLITNRAATLHATSYGTPTGTAATVLHTLTL